MRLDLVLDQFFRAVLQRLLNLTDANATKARLQYRALDHQVGEEVRFPGTAAAMRALVASGLEERLEYPCGGNVQLQGC